MDNLFDEYHLTEKFYTFSREIPADFETPVSIYLKVRNGGPSFLLESVTGGNQLARYSFIGVNPQEILVVRNHKMEQHINGKTYIHSINPGEDPFITLKEKMVSLKTSKNPAMPRFWGGLVGYVSYEIAGYYESHVVKGDDSSKQNLPEAVFLYCETVIAFDHAYGKLMIITNLPRSMDEKTAYESAEKRLDEIEESICSPINLVPSASSTNSHDSLQSNTAYSEFIQMIKEAKEHIAAGDIFQVVLSQRFSRNTPAEPIDIYRALRRLNPSPYMFFFDFNTTVTSRPFQLIGASPEMHVRLEGGTASIRPIAGTRSRGSNFDEDLELKNDLLNDPKERAEHVMLVDLARNDLGRVCSYGSVRVPEFMNVENYSHVMHIVSQVEGTILPGYDSFDLLRATFPAGTVSGAPKIRAMQIISDLEKDKRGPYAGAVGYFSFDGSMDTCITIRTLVMTGDEVQIQAGAGIVADSIPDNEYQESINKAKALSVAIEMAENPSYRVRKI